MDADAMLAHYSRALDEIYRLRAALAYEARLVEVHLGYATFPKTRRGIAAEQVERMQAAARGDAVSAYRGVGFAQQKWALEHAGADTTLTRGQWEQTDQPATAEVLTVGEDIVVECVCGHRQRGYTNRAEAQTDADRHRCAGYPQHVVDAAP